MAKQDKKLQKLKDRLAELETELRTSLTKKASGVAEVDVAGYNRKIEDVRKQIAREMA